MKISFNYAIEFGSEVPPEIQADAMEEAWAAMEAEGELNRERVDLYDYILEEPLVTVEGFDYAIMAISEHPRAVVVDFGRQRLRRPDVLHPPGGGEILVRRDNA
jgi:hypothetical protein